LDTLENLADFSQTYCYFQAAEEQKGGQVTCLQ